MRSHRLHRILFRLVSILTCAALLLQTTGPALAVSPRSPRGGESQRVNENGQLFQTPPCTEISIQRGTNGQAADAYITQTAPDYNGNVKDMYVSRYTTGSKHTLVRFDLSAIPAGATIEWARIQM